MRTAFRVGLIILSSLNAGCSLAPKNFREMLHPAPIVRARAAGLDETRPEWQAVPALIERLDDSDPVVRLTAHENLKERTGKDFGFVPWSEGKARTDAISKWRAWWKSRREDSYAEAVNDLGRKRRPEYTPRRRLFRR